MWQTKYASAEPKNLGLGLNFQPLLHTYKVQIKSLLQKDVYPIIVYLLLSLSKLLIRTMSDNQ